MTALADLNRQPSSPTSVLLRLGVGEASDTIPTLRDVSRRTQIAPASIDDQGPIDRITNRLAGQFRAARLYPAAAHPPSPGATHLGYDGVEHSTGIAGSLMLRVPAGTPIEQLCDALAQISTVTSVSPNYVSQLPFDVGEPLPVPDSGDGGWNARRMVRMQEALAIELGDEGVVVGLIDSGVNTSHPEFVHTFRAGFDTVRLESGDVAAGIELLGDHETMDMRPRDIAQALKGLHMMAVPPNSPLSIVYLSDVDANLHNSVSKGTSTSLLLELPNQTTSQPSSSVPYELLASSAMGKAFSNSHGESGIDSVRVFVRDASYHLSRVVYKGSIPEDRMREQHSYLKGVGEGNGSVRLVGLGEACQAAAVLCGDNDIAAVASLTNATLDALHAHSSRNIDEREPFFQPRTLAAVLAGLARVFGGADPYEVAAAAAEDEGIELGDVQYVYDLIKPRLISFDAPSMRITMRALLALTPGVPDADILLRSLEWTVEAGVSECVTMGKPGAQQLLGFLSHIIESARLSGCQWLSRRGRPADDRAIYIDPGLDLQLQSLVNDAKRSAACNFGMSSESRVTPTWAAGDWDPQQVALLDEIVAAIKKD